MPPASEAASPTSSLRSAIPFLIGCAIFLALMELIGTGAMKGRTSGPDFRSFYTAGYMVRTHPSTLYDLSEQKRLQDMLVFPTDVALPFFHPPYEALVYAPFSLLPYHAAYYSFIVFNVLLLIGAFFAARDAFSRSIAGVQSETAPGLMLLLFIPVVIAVWHGQDSILFLLLAALTWRELARGRDLPAGCILALALFRFQLALPIALLMLIRRGWKFGAGFAAAGALVAAACFTLVGRTGIAQWRELLAAGSLSSDTGAIAQRAMAIYPPAMPNLFGLLYGCGAKALSPHAAFVLTAIVSLAIVLWSIGLVRRAPSVEAAFGFALVCAVMVSYHLYLHDASLLLLAMALLAPFTARGVVGLCYWLPLAIFFLAGTNWYFVLALPALALLFVPLRNSQRAAEMIAPQRGDAKAVL